MTDIHTRKTITLSGMAGTILLGCILSSQLLFAQSMDFDAEGTVHDKCGYDEQLAMAQLQILGDHWGYGYENLLQDLERWQQSPFVTIDSLGASVQGRAIWQLTNTSDIPPGEPRRTVFLHARTHPGEVQGWWVTNELITLLLAEDAFAQFIRESCTFYIIPMYNPDGVELEYPRQNAKRIDIESNWNKNPVEPEVAVLRSRFSELMSSNAAIEAALNMHSAVACKRYFVYHDAAGTSPDFTVLEQDFIEGVRRGFLSGIEPWHYYVSWTNGTLTQYPESWFWLNHGESVMALTYEDMNCSAAGDYGQTATALLHGIADYLGLVVTAISERGVQPVRNFWLDQNYPNPFNPSTTIRFGLAQAGQVIVRVVNLRGQLVATLADGSLPAGEHRIEWQGRDNGDALLASGVYLFQLVSENHIETRKLVLIK